jgi:hypothetical protein
MKNIHLVPTEKPSRLYNNNGQLHLDNVPTTSNGHTINQNIYITSDEEIKEGDWVYCRTENRVLVSNVSYSNLEDRFKIILTTDPDLIADGVQAVDDEFLEWFVKNPNCEYVEVEKYFYEVGNDFDYEIILPQEEPKQAPFLEADKFDGEWLSPVPEERAWQEENLKKIFESYPNGFPKWSYLNGLILLGLKRIEIINKKNQNIDDLEEPKQETLEETGEFHFEKQVSNPYPTGTVAYTAYEKGFDNGAKWQANRSV